MGHPATNPTSSGTGIAVVVPSYRRPELLRLCLEALSLQTEAAKEIVVVCRAGDGATAAELAEWPRIRAVVVEDAGVVAAMSAGVAATAAEIVAFTDDDAAPRPDWLATLHRHFCDPAVGAVGGRDVVDRPTQAGPLTQRVGKIERSGRVTGNHHLGCGAARDVAVLKGVNMAFRRPVLSFPSGLRGSGAQVDFEVACCLAAADRGWRLVYDPEAVVDHTVGPRFDADRRQRPERTAVSDAAYNRLAMLLSLRPWLGVRRAIFGLLIGERATPGLARAVAALARGEGDVLHRLLPSLSGQLVAIVDVLRGRRVRMMGPGAHAPGATPVARASASNTR